MNKQKFYSMADNTYLSNNAQMVKGKGAIDEEDSIASKMSNCADIKIDYKTDASIFFCRAIIHDENITSANTIAVFTVLCDAINTSEEYVSYVEGTGEERYLNASISIESLSTLSRLSVPSVLKHLKILEENGYIIKHSSRKGNDYVVLRYGREVRLMNGSTLKKQICRKIVEGELDLKKAVELEENFGALKVQYLKNRGEGILFNESYVREIEKTSTNEKSAQKRCKLLVTRKFAQ